MEKIIWFRDVFSINMLGSVAGSVRTDFLPEFLKIIILNIRLYICTYI